MTGVGLGESSQGLQRREVTMQATGGEERVSPSLIDHQVISL